MPNIIIAVGTCKKYSDVALIFNKVNRKFLSSYDMFYLTDGFIQDLPVDMQIVDSSDCWSKRMANSLSKLNSSHVLFFLDDYFFFENIFIPEFINLDEVGYMRLVNIPSTANLYLDTDTDYNINFQPALWDRQLLINMLQDNDYTPWEAEVNLNYLFNHYNKFSKEKVYLKFIDSYLNAVIKGEWSRLVIKHEIDISNSNRATMPIMSWFFYRVKSFLSARLSKVYKNIFKKLLGSFGFKFYK